MKRKKKTSREKKEGWRLSGVGVDARTMGMQKGGAFPTACKKKGV